MRYYVALDRKKVGPFTWDDLPRARITPQTLVWHEGLPAWQPAQSLPEFHELLSPKANLGLATSATSSPDKLPEAPPPALGAGETDWQHLRALAKWQRTLGGLAGLVFFGLGLVVGGFVGSQDWTKRLLIFFVANTLLLAYPAYQVAKLLKLNVAYRMISVLIPGWGVFASLELVSLASKEFKKHGIPMGWWGARLEGTPAEDTATTRRGG